MNNNEILEAVTAAQKGDVKAFEKLYAEYAKSTYFIALRLLQNQQNAEEITQDVFVYVYKKISDLNAPQAFPDWLKKITVNKCTDFLRKKFPTETDIDEIAESEFIEESNPKLVPEKALDNEATAKIILDIIDNLPLPQKVCVYYYYYEQLSVKEIAEQLEIKETTVKNRLALARDKIRKELEKLEDKEGIRLYSVFPFFLFTLLKSAENKTDVPSGILGNVLLETGVGTAAGTTAAATAKAGLSIKSFAAIAAGVIVTGGIITGAVVMNSSRQQAAETADASVTSQTVFINEEFTQGTTEIAAETTTTESEIVELRFGFDDITDEKLAEMVADGTIPHNVTDLDLTCNDLTNVAPLSELPNLTVLNLDGNNEIKDLSSFSSLTQLKELNLHNINSGKNGLDLTPLSNLTNLTYLDLYGVNAVNLTALSGLTKLTYLDLHESEISDVEFARNLTNLTYLNLDHSPGSQNKASIADISPLSGLTKLETLTLYENKITDISVLANMPDLQELDIAQNEVEDISVLSSLTKLTDLSLWGNEITDISPLNSLPELSSVLLNSNNISDISPLFGLSKLTHINLEQNSIDKAQLDIFKSEHPECSVND